jgi:hypothetical protein
MVLAAVVVPLWGYLPAGQGLINHNPLPGGIFATAAQMSAILGVRPRPWHLAAMGALLNVIGRAAYANNSMDDPGADLDYVVNLHKIPAYFL